MHSYNQDGPSVDADVGARVASGLGVADGDGPVPEGAAAKVREMDNRA
ncbi:MAG: hypothetical protein WKF94_16975 [Solirubrobacteraceae bacterium]